MRCFVLLSLALVFILLNGDGQVFAQPGKIPYVREIYHAMQMENMLPDANALKYQLTTSKQLVFRSGHPGCLDTTEGIDMKFNSRGQLTESRTYKFCNIKVREKAPLNRLNYSNITDIEQIINNYDGEGNLLSERTSSIEPAGSPSAFMIYMERKHAMDGFAIQKSLGNDTAEQERKLSKSVDDFLAINKTETAYLKEEKIYTYNKKNNPATQEYDKGKRKMRYVYQYDKNGQLVTFRQAYHADAEGSPEYFSTYEAHFSYSTNGKPDTVKVYSAEMDTGNAALYKYLQSTLAMHYDEDGNEDALYGKGGGREVVQRFQYSDRLRTACLITTINPANGKEDTSSHTVYTYEGKNMVESVTTYYRDKRVIQEDKDDFTYNSRGLATSQISYRWEEPIPGRYTPGTHYYTLRELCLLFYGNEAEDKATAALKANADVLLKKEYDEQIKRGQR